MEFLGDAILDAVVGDIVYRHFEGRREGFLTNARSKLVQRETLNNLAESMGLLNLVLSSGRGNSHNSYMGGNAFEALVGAIYLDRGYSACMRFMEEMVLGKYLSLDKMAYMEVNFKSKLIEWSQKNRVNMEYRLAKEGKDKDGNPIFDVVVLIEGMEAGKGHGFSKKESQQQASKMALSKLKEQPQFIDAVFKSKGKRTKMDEKPVVLVDDAIFENGGKTVEKKEKPQHQEAEEKDEFDLSDIKMPGKQSREDIISAAEEEAFGNVN